MRKWEEKWNREGGYTIAFFHMTQKVHAIKCHIKIVTHENDVTWNYIWVDAFRLDRKCHLCHEILKWSAKVLYFEMPKLYTVCHAKVHHGCHICSATLHTSGHTFHLNSFHVYTSRVTWVTYFYTQVVTALDFMCTSWKLHLHLHNGDLLWSGPRISSWGIYLKRGEEETTHTYGRHINLGVIWSRSRCI